MAVSSPITRKILLLGTYQSMVAATRLLGQAGHSVVVGRSQVVDTYAEHSRHAAEVWDHPDAGKDPDALVAHLCRFLDQRPDITTVMPMGDLEIAALSERRGSLPASVTLVMQPESVVDTCENKIKLMRLADTIGIPQAAYGLVDGIDALFEQAAAIGYPCIVKASDSRSRAFGKKALIFHDAESLRRRFDRWPEGPHALIVQHYVQGPRFNISVVARDGAVVGMAQNRAARTDRGDGTGVVVEGVSVPLDAALADNCRALSKALSLHGVALFQFLQEADTCAWSLLEINPRMGSNFPIAVASGYNLPVLALKIAHGEPLDPSETPQDYPAGKRCIWTLGDLFGIREDLRNGDIGAGQAARRLLTALGAFTRADIHVAWSWRDPLPAIMGLMAPFRRLLARRRQAVGR